MPRHWTEGDKLSLAEMLTRGDSVRDVATVFGRNPNEIEGMAMRLSIPLPKRKQRQHGPATRILVRWSKDEQTLVKRMWTDGQTSGQIVKALKGRSRGSVMGLVRRLGMVRNPRVDIQGCDFHTVYGKAMERVAPIGRDEILAYDELDEGIQTHHLLDIHLEITFLMAVMLYGRDPALLRMACEEPMAKIVKLLARLETTGVWHAGVDRPARWDRPGAKAQVLIMDAMVLKGIMLIGGQPREPRYSLPYVAER